MPWPMRRRVPSKPPTSGRAPHYYWELEKKKDIKLCICLHNMYIYIYIT